MKIHHLGLLAVLIPLFMACQNNNPVETETIEDNGTFNLYDGCPSTFEYNAIVEFPIGGAKEDVLRNIQENITSTVFGLEYSPGDIRTVMEKYKENSVQNYRETNIEEWKQFGHEEGWAASFNWVEGLNSGFLPKYKNMQSYRIYRYGFTGGAHGIDSEDAIVFDLTTGNIITESHIFNEGWEKPMAELLTSHLKEAYEDPEAYEMLFVKEIEPNGNFYVTEKGITYIYGRYEIGPYVIGITNVTVPWEELKDLLK